jgi:hypothetical protein
MNSNSLPQDLVAGFVPLSIADIVRYMPNFFKGLAMLITVIDSGPASSLNLENFRGRGLELKPYGTAVLVQEPDVEVLLKDGWPFDGFDEVFLLKPPVNFHVSDFSEHFTTDARDFSQDVPVQFLDMFQALNAVRYLSDGCGLNFACEAEEAKLILELDDSLDQGEPISPDELESPVGSNGDDILKRPARSYYLPKYGKPNSTLEKFGKSG